MQKSSDRERRGLTVRSSNFKHDDPEAVRRKEKGGLLSCFCFVIKHENMHEYREYKQDIKQIPSAAKQMAHGLFSKHRIPGITLQYCPVHLPDLPDIPVTPEFLSCTSIMCFSLPYIQMSRHNKHTRIRKSDHLWR